MSDHAGKTCGKKGAANRTGLRLVLAYAMVLSLAACSSMPDWTRPAFIYGDEPPAKATTAATSFPNLADVPKNAPSVTAAGEQQQLANDLSTDRSQSEAADVALRKGNAAAVVNMGTSQSGVSEHPVAGPDTVPVAPTMTPAPGAAQKNSPLSEAPIANTEKEKLVAAEPAATPQPEPQPTAEAPATREEDMTSSLAAVPEKSSAPEQKAALPAGLGAGTEAEAVPPAASVAPPAPKLAAVETAPVLTPPTNSADDAPTGGIVAFPSRGGHTRITEIKGGIQLSEVGDKGARPEVTSDEDQESGNSVPATPTTPVEVKPAASAP